MSNQVRKKIILSLKIIAIVLFLNQPQVEIDIERHVLSQRKKLTDNTFEKIFTRNDRNESGMFTYNCHLCAVPNLTGERALQTHITGKKHQQRLMVEYVPNAAQFRTPLVQKPKRKFLYFITKHLNKLIYILSASHGIPR